jgi:Flp pilus assembly protein TadG
MTRCRPSRADRGRTQAGAAVVDFVLVSMVLVPLVLGIVQVALVLHVRNTLVAAAGEGARYAATVDRAPQSAVIRTRAQIDDALAARYADDVSATTAVVAGVPTIVVRVRADVPPLGLWGPGIPLEVEAHAVEELLP